MTRMRVNLGAGIVRVRRVAQRAGAHLRKQYSLSVAGRA